MLFRKSYLNFVHFIYFSGKTHMKQRGRLILSVQEQRKLPPGTEASNLHKGG